MHRQEEEMRRKEEEMRRYKTIAEDERRIKAKKFKAALLELVEKLVELKLVKTEWRKGCQSYL